MHMQNMHVWIVILMAVSLGIAMAIGMHELYQQIAHALTHALGS